MPEGTKSVVMICEDSDAPLPKPFVHWLAYDIAATTRGIPAPFVEAKEGKNSTLTTGFIGAAPPPGHGMHHYHFQVFALDRMGEHGRGLGRGAVLDFARGHVLAWGELVGTYGRF